MLQYIPARAGYEVTWLEEVKLYLSLRILYFDLGDQLY
jgi:hypothetical protein